MAVHPCEGLRKDPIGALKKGRRLMASILTWLIGFLFLGIGLWILLLRFEGLADWFRPHSISIGHMFVDGQENRGYAELLRARFDHHFRRADAIPKETGFLEMASLDLPGLFEQKESDGTLEQMSVNVSGVDVTKVVQFFNQLAKPDQWIVEGDFQTQTGRALLAMRLSRGDRVIRTWYLERSGDTSRDKSILLEQLTDDAIFQLVYDFSNNSESDRDLRKWRKVIPAPTSFPNPAAVAAYYEGQGSLGRYYAHGKWADLDMALDRLQTLRAQMPEYADGLRLLAMALAEKRNDTEAIHVYEQLRSVLLANDDWSKLDTLARRGVLSTDLLKATARINLNVWQSTHQAIAELVSLMTTLRSDSSASLSSEDQAAYGELRAQTAVQLAYAYASYLDYVRLYPVADMFGAAEAPTELRVSEDAELQVLRDGPPEEAKAIVRRVMQGAAREHAKWIKMARQEQGNLESQWQLLSDWERRKSDLASRLELTSGYASYHMAELERRDAKAADTIFGQTFRERLKEAGEALRKADAAHPNHYVVLQLLGLVHSDPRLESTDLSISEQYLERAVQANPSDGNGHELLAAMKLRRVANIGIDLPARSIVEEGLKKARKAVSFRDTSGNAHLLRAKLQAVLVELEQNETARGELRKELEQYIDQADRFLPRPFGRPDVDLSWVRILAAMRNVANRSQTAAQPGSHSKSEILAMIDQLIADCNLIEARWVADQRIFQVQALHQRASRLRKEIEQATDENWQTIHIPFL